MSVSRYKIMNKLLLVGLWCLVCFKSFSATKPVTQTPVVINCNDSVHCLPVPYYYSLQYDVYVNDMLYPLSDMPLTDKTCNPETLQVIFLTSFSNQDNKVLDYSVAGGAATNYNFSFQDPQDLVTYLNQHLPIGTWGLENVSGTSVYNLTVSGVSPGNLISGIHITISSAENPISNLYSSLITNPVKISSFPGCKNVSFYTKADHILTTVFLLRCEAGCVGTPLPCNPNTLCTTQTLPKEETTTLKHPCESRPDGPNGEITVNYSHLIDQYFPSSCSNQLTYTLYQDNLYNKHWDPNCIITPANVHSNSMDTIFENLPFGDYFLEINCTPYIGDECLNANLMPQGNMEDTAYWFEHDGYTDVHPNDKYLLNNNPDPLGANNLLPEQMVFMKNQHYIGKTSGRIYDSCVDHTTGTGWMLGVHTGLGNTGNIFSRYVNTERCSYYQFKFYYKTIGYAQQQGPAAIYYLRRPNFQVSVNGIDIPLSREIEHRDYPYISAYQDGWHEMIYTWYSGNSTNAVITINDQRILPSYFALDDLSFNKIKDCGRPTVCPIRSYLSLNPVHYNIIPEEVLFVCPKDTLKIQTDSALFTNVLPWQYCCGNELDATHKIDVTPNTHLFTGGTFGGYMHIEAYTNEGCYAKDTIYVADLNPPGLTLKEVDSVLNVSATKFRSIWKPLYSGVQWSSAEELNAFKNKLSYQNGTFGMFRARQAYDYIDVRTLSANNSGADVKLRMDGTFNDVKLFNWNHPGLLECAPEWKLNHTISNYNPGSFEVENKDILDRYSAALYGYGGKLEIAVAANAAYEEIGFENFEEYASAGFSQQNQLNNTTGNIDLVPNITGLRYPYVLEYDIDAAFGRYALVKNIEGNLCCDIPLDVTFNGNSLEKNNIPSQNINSRGKVIVKETPCPDADDSRLVVFQTAEKSKPFPFSSGPLCDRFWTGTLLVNKEVLVFDQQNPKLSLTQNTAHTGKNALKIDPGFTSIPQYDLHLKSGRNYVVSAWVQSDLIKNAPPEKLEYTNKSNGTGITVKVGSESTSLYPSGEVIEGWQRLEGVIHVTDGSKVPYLEFSNTTTFYLDDIRIFPENGSIQTYVYDPSNYKLRSTLDQNNYSTLYQYDDEGNLFSIKKETVNGIKTIQSTQNYIKIKKP